MMWRRPAATTCCAPPTAIASSGCRFPLAHHNVVHVAMSFAAAGLCLRPRRAAGMPSAPDAGVAGVEALCEWVGAGECAVRRRNLPPTRHAELLPQDVAVRLRGPRGDPETLAHLVVRAACSDEMDDLPLTFGEIRRTVRERMGHAPSEPAAPSANHCPKGVFSALRLLAYAGCGRERRVVSAPVRFLRLGSVERADPQQQVELVA
jgi:hypothetical protein